MARILILYASFDGQTARIAHRVATTLEGKGHGVTLRSAEEPAAARDIEDHDAVIIGAAVRFGHHARSLEDLVRKHAGAIAGRPNAFFSVSLSAGGPGARPAEAARQVAQFCERTGWEPVEVANFAGALQYSKYNPFIRFMMRLIVGASGGDTDASQDYEYTDWKAVERFAARFATQLERVTVG